MVDEPTAPVSGSALRTRAAGEASQVVSILEVIQRLKEQIKGKDRIIREKTGELLATRDYLRRIFSSLADAVLVIDTQGRIEFANEAACELLETSTPELIGRRAGQLVADPEQATWFEPDALAGAGARGASQRTEVRLRTGLGAVIPVQWSTAPLTRDGRPAGLVGIARDVRVERRVEAEKLRAVQALAAGVAHEIRNPLGAIQNSVGLLLRDLKLEGDDQTLLEIVFRETERISGIVEEFLRFARPAQIDPQPGDLPALLEQVVTLAEQDERALGGIRLLLHVAEGLPRVRFDADGVRQVVWNLISNALDAAEASVAVRARVTRSGDVEVRVADDGPGMPEEVLRRATEPFRTTKATGSGLGLAISKRIVLAHGGVLRLESAPGAGTGASFTLPAAPAPGEGEAV